MYIYINCGRGENKITVWRRKEVRVQAAARNGGKARALVRLLCLNLPVGDLKKNEIEHEK